MVKVYLQGTTKIKGKKYAVYGKSKGYSSMTYGTKMSSPLIPKKVAELKYTKIGSKISTKIV